MCSLLELIKLHFLALLENQNRLRGPVSDDYFSILSPLSLRRDVSSFSLLHLYFHCKCWNKLHYIVLPALRFEHDMPYPCHWIIPISSGFKISEESFFSKKYQFVKHTLAWLLFWKRQSSSNEADLPSSSFPTTFCSVHIT